MITISKRDLMELGYGSTFATNIIREAKQKMVEKGYTFYQSRKLDIVPKEAIEEILGIKLTDSDDDIVLPLISKE